MSVQGPSGEMPTPKFSGKKALTQLDKGSSELVKEERVGPTRPVSILQMQEVPYTEVQAAVALYRSAYLTGPKSASAAKPSAQIIILRDTGKVFLDPSYKAHLMSGQVIKMDDAKIAQAVNLKEYRADLVNLRDQYQKMGLIAQKECLDVLITALDKRQLLTLPQIKKTFELLGNDAEVDRKQALEILDEMVRQGNLTPEDAANIKKNLKGDNVKINDLVKQTAPVMVVQPVGTGGGKATAITATGYRVPKGLPVPKAPMTRKLMAGQLCGPSRPIMQNIADIRETGVQADLPLD